MSRRANPITLQVLPPEISFEQATQLIAEATAILLRVKERRLARLAQQEQESQSIEQESQIGEQESQPREPNEELL